MGELLPVGVEAQILNVLESNELVPGPVGPRHVIPNVLAGRPHRETS